MAKSLKHVGKIKNTGSKVLVVFRTLPGESDKALVLPTATLPDIYHNSIMELVETEMAQQSYELGEIMFVRSFPDGRNMLQAMQVDNRLQKVSTDNIIMTPTPVSEIPLDQLNLLIAEQKNCTVDELCTFVKGATPVSKKAEVQESATVNSAPASTPAAKKLQAADNTPLSDTDIAKSYRSQADALYKEAALLRKQADELDPPKRRAAKVAEDAGA
jgi:hypothetical protein